MSWNKAAWAACLSAVLAACLRCSAEITRRAQILGGTALLLEQEDMALRDALQARHDQADIERMAEQEAALRKNLSTGRYLANDGNGESYWVVTDAFASFDAPLTAVK